MIEVEVLGPQRRGLDILFAGQVSLGERRPLVGQPGLLTDECDRPPVSLGTQRERKLKAGVSAPTITTPPASGSGIRFRFSSPIVAPIVAQGES